MNELLMLGNPLLRINDKPLVMRDKKGLGLIAYLAVNGETNRDTLADLLWSDLGQSDARRNLRQRLYELKTKIPNQLFATEGDMVRLETPINTDLSWYQSQLESGDFEAAVQVWRGAFLDALEIPGAEGFQEWLELKRSELTSSYHEALRQVASTREANGDLRGALEAHKRLLQDDELQEFHQREVMRLLELLGEHETALLQFERFSQTLDQELGDTPLPETRAIAQRLRNANTRGSTPVLVASPILNLHAPLIGRESTWQKIKAKTNVLHLILGEPGIGKSRLASEFAQDHSPTITLRGREGSSGSALYPVAEALRQTLLQPDWLSTLEPIWKAECARLIPEFDLEHATHAPPANLEGRVRFLEGLSRALLASLETTGTIVLDDLQWFDPLSLEFVGHLTRRALESGVRLISTARPQELSENEAATPILNDLKREGTLETHQLKALKERDVRGMIQALTGGNDAPRFAQRLHNATTGNPFFMLETLRDLFSAGELQVMTSGEWYTPYALETETYNELRIPTTVRETVIARVDRAGAATRRLLEAASLAGDGFDLNLIASATALNEWEGLEGIERAVQAELLETHPNGYKFNHDLTRRALEDGLSLDRRKLLHRKLAVSLVTQNGMPERIAVHYEEGGQPREAAPWRVKAGEAATKVYAYELALEHYGKALEDGLEAREAFSILVACIQLHKILDDRAQWELRVIEMEKLSEQIEDINCKEEFELEKAEFYFACGKFEKSFEYAENVFKNSKHGDQARVLLTIATSLNQLGREKESEQRIIVAFNEGLRGDLVYQGRLKLILGHRAYLQKDLEMANRYTSEAINFFQNKSDKQNHIRALFLRGQIECDFDESIKVFLEALTEAGSIGVIPLQREALLFIALRYLEIDDGKMALNFLKEGLVLNREPQDPHIEMMFNIYLSQSYWILGELEKSLKFANLSIKNADKIGKLYNKLWCRIHHLSILLEKNDLQYFSENIKFVESFIMQINVPEIQLEYITLIAKFDFLSKNYNSAIKKNPKR
jgi:DNA-binding SARP family transcriptional activator